MLPQSMLPSAQYRIWAAAIGEADAASAFFRRASMSKLGADIFVMIAERAGHTSAEFPD
jgi:hypothetical protein